MLTKRMFMLALLLVGLFLPLQALAETIFTAALDGSQEVPPIGSPSTGNCTAILNTAQTQLAVTCSHDVPDVAAAHIHNAPVGVNGDIVFPFTNPASPISETWTPVSSPVCEGSCLTQLFDGNLYVNIHSPTYPGGEIRGQLLLPAIPTLPQWGLILLTLSLLSLATWQLAGQPALLRVGTTSQMLTVPDRSSWFSSLLIGQGIASLYLGLYAICVGPLVPHDGGGALLAGILLGTMIECYRRGR